MSFSNTTIISASALTAQRLRQDVIAQNLANVDTTRTEDGGAYKRKIVLFQERTEGDSAFSRMIGNVMQQNAGSAGAAAGMNFRDIFNYTTKGEGVRVSRIVDDETPGTMVYEPGHPDADENGYVTRPNVNPVVEMVNMISATRAYEANVTAMGTTKSMVSKTLEIATNR
jgi:flagellar basal-body rod protein FlgC